MKMILRMKNIKATATFKTNLFFSWFNLSFRSKALEETRLLSILLRFLFDEARVSFCLCSSCSTLRLLSSQSLIIIHWFSKISCLVKTTDGFSSFKILSCVLMILNYLIFCGSSAHSNNKNSISSFSCLNSSVVPLCLTS